jgi:uncharacterized damage-inducible protein DinB
MTLSQQYVPEFDMEMVTTHRLLERVPGAKMEWKPHAKSFALGHLAQLIARMPAWITHVLEAPHLDLSTGPTYTFETPATLLAEFDANVRQARAAMAAASDAHFATPWSLTFGEKVLFTLPRGEMVRQNINHLIHHRGQLSVYLRLLDVPLPSIYGPTADERGF